MAGLAQAELRRNHVNNALSASANAVQNNPALSTVAFQGAEHFLRQRIRKRTRLRGGGNDVVHRGNSPFGASDGEPLVTQTRERLGTGDFVNQMETHEQLCGPPGQICHPMKVPHLVVEGAGTQQRCCND